MVENVQITNTKKRPGVVWSYSIIVVLLMLFSIGIMLFFGYSEATKRNVSPLLIIIISLLFVSPLIITDLIFIYKFFMLEKKSLLWLYISFGIGLVYGIIRLEIVSIIGLIIMGFALRDYIKNKKIDEIPLFT
ncbi:hypothetical protein HYV80_00030 [Candidatus Woesearchaeota archaeon]|nr:hypothetical protein [Candidatus Woesearchaeota archaeon]